MVKKFVIAVSFFKIIAQLPSPQRTKFWLLLFSMIALAVLETMSLGIIALFVSCVTDPEKILQASYVGLLKRILGLDFLSDKQGLTIFLSISTVFFVLFKNSIKGFVSYASQLYVANVSGYLGERLLHGFLQLPYEWHLTRNSADLIIGVQWRQHVGLFLNSVLIFLSEVLVVIFIFITLLVVNPFVSLVVILIVGGVAFFIFKGTKGFVDKIAIKNRDYHQSINRHTTKALHGIKDVKIHGKELSFTHNFTKEVYILARMRALQSIAMQIPSLILETVGFFMLAATICLMLFFMDSSKTSVVGTVTLLALAAWRVLPAFNRILSNLTQMRTYHPYINNILSYLKEVKKHVKDSSTEAEKYQEFSLHQSIEFQNVFFKYQTSNEYALRNLNLKIRVGQTIGIVGPSGAGKSTLVNILIGLFSPCEGCIKIDGVKITSSQLAGWRRAIGYVPQTSYIYEGTLAENVAFGLNKSEIDRDHVQKCCYMAAMQDFLSRLPKGIDTQIGERGVLLSGGQMQRVAIARALYQNPQIMIFDEATSALDTKNEQAVQKTIYSLRDEMTLIIIAHRLSTVGQCDIIIWLDNGKIRKIGKASDIIEKYKETLSFHEPNKTLPLSFAEEV